MVGRSSLQPGTSGPETGRQQPGRNQARRPHPVWSCVCVLCVCVWLRQLDGSLAGLIKLISSIYLYPLRKRRARWSGDWRRPEGARAHSRPATAA